MTKRILYVMQGLGVGGVSSVILNYYRNLTENLKADFVVIVPYERIPSLVRKELENNGCRIFHVTPFVKSMVKYKNEVKEIIRQGNYDIVHDNNKYFAFLSLSSAKKMDVPTRICHVHNTVATQGKRMVHKCFIKVASRLSICYANRLLACSEEAGRSMYKNREFTVLRNAIDVRRYSYNEELRRKWREEFGVDEEFVLIMVARRDIIKRYDHAFRVFDAVCKECDNAQFWTVGIDENDCESRDLNTYHNLDECVKCRIKMLGRRLDANELLNAADAFILTSEHEGLGISVIEAQTNGLNCFVSQGVPQEVNFTGLVKFLPTLGDPKEWSKCICDCRKEHDREYYSGVLVQSDYSIQKALSSIKEIYSLI